MIWQRRQKRVTGPAFNHRNSMSSAMVNRLAADDCHFQFFSKLTSEPLRFGDRPIFFP